jgi:hypothetical protein
MIHELILVSFRLFGVVLKQGQFTIRDAVRYSQSIAKSGTEATCTEPDLHRPDPCTIFAAKVGFTSALLWSDPLIETAINNIPAGDVCVESSNARSVFSSSR